MLTTLVGEPEADVKALFAAMQREDFDGTGFLAPHAQARTALERERCRRFALMFETLTDRYDNALRTSTLLRSDAPGFVLFLHGFSLELHDDAEQSVGYESDLGLYLYRFDLARNLAPTPLVLVRNPAQSESLVGIFPGASEAAPTTFALDLYYTWEASVGSLIEAASFVVLVPNDVVREGLRTELRLLQERGRLGDTFFTDAHEAQKLLPGKTLRRLDDGALALMRHAARPRGPEGRRRRSRRRAGGCKAIGVGASVKTFSVSTTCSTVGPSPASACLSTSKLASSPSRSPAACCWSVSI